ncbi:hypothetical protein HYG86_17995 [Alkalicella caledoniensis]|uniref:DUF3784 domain-containing protein n=1 Tax=Alkalicella caledoniensis TaxID=2731377 RepID=A0A7G9WCW8_ALKCA|nr:hypothetical protein [Alkalicella caledoniensis]QNO16530.1 hypothetical protein HYG86_17995 [Alkalicella caledoniensis]
MNPFGVFLIVFGITYLTYSIIFRNKVTIYFKNIKVVKGKEDKYFKMQLFFSILNSSISLIIGGMMVLSSYSSSYSIYMPLIPLLFYLVNFIMKQLGKAKGYIR